MEQHLSDLKSLFSANNVIITGAAIAIITYLWSQIRSVFSPLVSFYLSRCTTFIEINDNTPAYHFCAIALSKKIPSKRGRFKVETNTKTTSYKNHFSDFSIELPGETISQFFLVPGYGLHIMRIGGCLCFARMIKRDLDHKENGKSYEETINLWFPFATSERVFKVLEEGRKLIEDLDEKSSTVKKYCAVNDYWDESGIVKYRDIDRIIFPEHKKKFITSKLSSFLDSKKWYINRNINYKTGFLFYGPPGNGKTSMIMALAYHYKMPVYTINLEGYSGNDESLITLIAGIKERSMLVFEDVDRIGVANGTKKRLSKVTLSGLLNALDGINSGEGFVTVLTANNPSIIDQALIRPGRVDYKIEFSLPEENEIKTFISMFYELNNTEGVLDSTVTKIKELNWSMAMLQAHCLYHRDSLDGCLASIEESNTNFNINNNEN